MYVLVLCVFVNNATKRAARSWILATARSEEDNSLAIRDSRKIINESLGRRFPISATGVGGAFIKRLSLRWYKYIRNREVYPREWSKILIRDESPVLISAKNKLREPKRHHGKRHIFNTSKVKVDVMKLLDYSTQKSRKPKTDKTEESSEEALTDNDH